MTINRRIDHLVLAVHDLTAAAEFYRALGFQVGARNRHPWGTENHVVQLGSSFLELITVADSALIPPHAPGSFSFGAFVRDYLTLREGLAMFVLDSADAAADAADFAREGIGAFAPFSFERAGRAADGSETHVAFTLAFAQDERLSEASFFVCQQLFPEAFWSPALQQHPNGATNVLAVDLVVPRPADHIAFLEAFTGVAATAAGHSYALAEHGELRVEAGAAPHGFTGFIIAVPELDDVAARLERVGVPFAAASDRLVIGSEHGFGAVITFRDVR
ncbi:VOC family protein [Microbacterium sp. 22242]|uniref:VOC family protein n=1 Tax=Microbacterium sp. 22242 TaxID=3453896 RepID=UPI003F86D858